MGFFNVDSALNFPGIKESFTLHDITSSEVDDRGTKVDITTDYTISGSVQVVTDEQPEIKEGSVHIGDLDIFVSENESNVTKITLDDTLTWNSTNYIVDLVVKNPGHYRFFARRL